MQTRPTIRKPQTSRQAKAEFHKHGPRISSQEQRQLERGAELWRRAEKIKDTERRRKQAAEKRRIREEKVKEERKRLNIKAPEPWMSPRQTRVVNFFKCGKTRSSKEEGKTKLHLSNNPKHDAQETMSQQSHHDPGHEETTEPETDEDEPAMHDKKEVSEHQMQSQRSFENFSFDEDTVAILDQNITRLSNAANQPHARERDIRRNDSIDTPSNLKATRPQIDQQSSVSQAPQRCMDMSARGIREEDTNTTRQANDTVHDLAMMLSTQDVTLSPQECAELGLKDSQRPLGIHVPKGKRGSPSARSDGPTRQAYPPINRATAIAPSPNQLMPPPPLPTKSSPPTKASTELTATWDPRDFILSTQDYREILG